MKRFTNPLRSALRRLARPTVLAPLAALALGATVVAPASAAYMLAPQYAGTFAAGEGANAEFHRIDNDWRGSAVLWDEPNKRFGRGAPIGSFDWGTGLWGQVDWLAIQQAAAGQPSAASGVLVQDFAGILNTINHANSTYLDCYSATWGPAQLVPFFAPADPSKVDCSMPDAGDPAQQNWTARYSGFIRITEPGKYNFSVLYDDGFFFRLIGADRELDIGSDFLNPRDRLGFGQYLQLDEGLYGFELGAWNRLGAGVVDLRWTTPGCRQASCQWALVPTENLLSSAQVPEPPVVSLVLAAFLLWFAFALREGSRRRHPRCGHPGS